MTSVGNCSILSQRHSMNSGLWPPEGCKTLISIGAAKNSADRARGTIELPVNLFDQQANLIGRVFAFAFDALGKQKDKMRIRLRRRADMRFAGRLSDSLSDLSDRLASRGAEEQAYTRTSVRLHNRFRIAVRDPMCRSHLLWALKITCRSH